MKYLIALTLTACGSCPIPDAEYAAALDAACGDLKSADCDPEKIEAIDREFAPRFEEAEQCRQR